MNKTQAIAIAGSVGSPSKMPGKSTGLPAEECHVGVGLQSIPGSVCADCYALKGFYVKYARNVKPAQYKRLDGITHPDWVEAMVTLIGDEDYFRWHDSGDVQSVEHLRRICQVCRRTPDTNHWLPTREYRIVEQYRQQYSRAVPSNLSLRLSGHMIDGPAPVTDLPTSTVASKAAFTLQQLGACPASIQDDMCMDCRACWDVSVPNVMYKQH